MAIDDSFPLFYIPARPTLWAAVPFVVATVYDLFTTGLGLYIATAVTFLHSRSFSPFTPPRPLLGRGRYLSARSRIFSLGGRASWAAHGPLFQHAPCVEFLLA